MIMAPVFGGLSDRYGRFQVLTIALLITGLSSYPMFLLLNTFPSVFTLLLVQAVVGSFDRRVPGADSGDAGRHIPHKYSRHWLGAQLQLFGHSVWRFCPADRDLDD